MPAIVEFPQIVQEALTHYGDLLANEPQRRHFAEYLTGLFLADRKTVVGINGEFAQTTDQSCLNRFLTAADWDVKAINCRRLELLQKDPSTRYHAQGAIAIDNVLIDHDGKLIEDVGYFWDHAEQRYKLAHDYIFADYVCSSGKRYPLDFRRFKKKEQCQEQRERFIDHAAIFRELVDWVCEEKIPGDFVFDLYFSGVDNLNHVHSKKDETGWPRAYVADLKHNRLVEWKGAPLRLNELAKQIPAESRKPIVTGDRQQWYFTVTTHLPGVKHKVRLVLLWHQRKDEQPCKAFATNRITWEVSRILRVYRKRWTGTETFHRDGKQELGMGDCQLRSGQGQTRHMYLVMLAYSLLQQQLRQGRAKEWALCKLMTVGEACRALLRESLRKTLAWALEQVTRQEQPLEHVVVMLGIA